MNPEVKDKWLTALRGGEYKQVDGYLRAEKWPSGNKTGFCCLGVLCELAVKEGVIPEPEPYTWEREPYTWAGNTRGKTFIYGVDAERTRHELPNTVATWAGLDELNPTVRIPYDVEDELENFALEDDGSYRLQLSEVNDDLGKDFNSIADLIEEQL